MQFTNMRNDIYPDDMDDSDDKSDDDSDYDSDDESSDDDDDNYDEFIAGVEPHHSDPPGPPAVNEPDVTHHNGGNDDNGADDDNENEDANDNDVPPDVPNITATVPKPLRKIADHTGTLPPTIGSRT